MSANRPAKSVFDCDRYLAEQTEAILKRMRDVGGKLYLEFGGKLF
ncbi:MAG: DUF1846 domain-containing protein, partial [Planctomycetota bacterium]